MFPLHRTPVRLQQSLFVCVSVCGHSLIARVVEVEPLPTHTLMGSSEVLHAVVLPVAKDTQVLTSWHKVKVLARQLLDLGSTPGWGYSLSSLKHTSVVGFIDSHLKLPHF